MCLAGCVVSVPKWIRCCEINIRSCDQVCHVSDERLAKLDSVHLDLLMTRLNSAKASLSLFSHLHRRFSALAQTQVGAPQADICQLVEPT